jgi:arylsulfatase A-like enzyme
VLRRLFDSPWTYFALAGVLLVVLLLTQFQVRLPPRPKGTIEDVRKLAERTDTNLIFILIDTLRDDHLHSYGYPRETSPVMDYLANTGIRFNRVISQSSWTKASMASLWTSSWPRRTGVLRWNHAVPDEAVMPAEVLQKAGFRTVGLWRNGWVAPNFGFQQGFSIYLRPRPGEAPAQFQHHRPSAEALQGSDEDVTRAAQGFLRSFGKDRFFLYLHYMDVHQYAYDVDSAKFGTRYMDSYDNAIHWVDRNVGVLLKSLADLGLWKRTIIVIAADHGEGFREHGLEGHARTLYKEVAEVPLIIALPFELKPGIVVDQTIGNVDIWPTVFALMGIPGRSGVDGHSELPLIEAAAAGDPPGEAPPYFAQLDRTWGRPSKDPSPLVGVTLGPYRLIAPLDKDGKVVETGKEELYDHRSDPWEHRNLLTAENGSKPVPADVEKALEGYLSNSKPAWSTQTPEVKLQEMELNQLRALGYVIQ